MSLEEFDNFLCPYCGQSNQAAVDFTQGPLQEFIVDCEVCCAPIQLTIRTRGEEIVSIEARRENE